MTLIQQYIGGAYIDATAGETFSSINPATGETLAELQSASQAGPSL